MQALVVRHFSHGGYYPIGGAQRIAEALLGTVAEAGGYTRIATDVKEILIEKKRAVGVRLEDGEVIRANAVVSAAGILSTARRLLPTEFRGETWVKEIESLSAAAAHVCLYLGFKGGIRAAGAGSANKWFYETWSTEDAAWDVGTAEHPTTTRAPVLYTSFPSLKDPSHDAGPEQRHTGEVVTFVPYEAFERWQGTRWKKRGPEYERFKADLEKRLLAQFLEHMPALAPMLDHVELSTPVSTETFVRPVLGSIYGIEPTPERFRTPWLRPRSPVRGLYFSGSDVATVGVVGAMMGGVLAAVAVEPVKVGRLLAPLVRRPDPHRRFD
jgi:all-trans-retinol 13,14-reductase